MGELDYKQQSKKSCEERAPCTVTCNSVCVSTIAGQDAAKEYVRVVQLWCKTDAKWAAALDPLCSR
jgi:hypothetical protein